MGREFRRMVNRTYKELLKSKNRNICALLSWEKLWKETSLLIMTREE